jgi:tetratricopeptide (TPR) repeat protein
MRTIIAALVGAALVAGSVGCTKGASKGSAWTRWGITKPTTAHGAEAKLADAYRLLYALKLDSAQSQYRDLAKRFPQSAEAHLGLSMAYRYSGRRDTALTEARAAYGLDSEATGVLLNYADLILPIRTGDLPGMSAAERYTESERCNLKAAASTHPLGAHAHTGLWASYMAQGRLSDARHQAFELSQKQYYPQLLLDLAYNLLVGLEPNAVLFTNGDNDTYPPWVLQQASDPFRPDVTVANLSLLNIPAVVKMMRDSLSLPVSLTDAEIAALAPKPAAGGKGVLLPSQQVVENIVANAAKAGRPVYFAVTVGKDMTGPYADRLVLEGLVNRVVEGKRSAAVDLDRITDNLTKKYRLDWPVTLPPWPQNMSPVTRMVAPLALNYAAAFVQMASLDDSLGRKDEAASAWTEAVEWIVRGGSTAVARDYVNAWLARDPVNPVAQRLKARLERAGSAR